MENKKEMLLELLDEAALRSEEISKLINECKTKEKYKDKLSSIENLIELKDKTLNRLESIKEKVNKKEYEEKEYDIYSIRVVFSLEQLDMIIEMLEEFS